ncbi:MAG: hypothetical protein R3C11_25440 [Planctomycetaceae bacterium]
MRLLLPILMLIPLLAGCVVTDTGVTNPIPGLSTVAVAPFLNLSSERAVDGRQFAEAYFAELQKTPGFEVVPVGVVETAMVQHGLEELRGLKTLCVWLRFLMSMPSLWGRSLITKLMCLPGLD